MRYGIFLLMAILLFSCEKEEIDEPCTSFPCGTNNPAQYGYNRVAYDKEFRIGTWVNFNDGAYTPDTIIFHNDSIWSNYTGDMNGHTTGIFNGRYEFEWVYLKTYMDYAGNELDPPKKWETRYNDTTGILSIVRQTAPQIGGGTWFDIDYYVKIE